MFMAGWSFERREARRALYAEAVRLREKKIPRRLMAPMLGLSPGRLGALLADPPWSEEALELKIINDTRRREEAKALEARRQRARRVLNRLRRKKVRQLLADEQHELRAQSLACLIEAYIEMRPYVGTEP